MTNSTARHDLPLRRALQANLAFSSLSALGLILGSGVLAALFGLKAGTILVGVGALLVPFAGLLLFILSRNSLSRGAAKLVIALDLLWVVGSAALLAWLPPGALSEAGRAAVVGVAVVVGLLAWFQLRGLRALPARA